jgi:protein gp37
MASNSKIEWTESSWNPVTGCTKISPGCANCYAERIAMRLKAMGQPNYRNGFNVTLHEHLLNVPLRWKKPKFIFVNSMSDLFHEDVPLDFIQKVFNIMRQADWHCFQILTKRSDRLLELNKFLKWLPNIWMGVSIENEDYIFRLDHLRKIGAKIKFLSCEPLIGSLANIDLRGIDWVIVGGESGPKARIMKESWVSDICNKCLNLQIPFFFKQWGGKNKKRAGRILNGRTFDEMPSYSCRTMALSGQTWSDGDLEESL